ncbi:hypothetical protein HK096_004789, partial [Nowakowskiella sp. JEL0078]
MGNKIRPTNVSDKPQDLEIPSMEPTRNSALKATNTVDKIRRPIETGVTRVDSSVSSPSGDSKRDACVF